MNVFFHIGHHKTGTTWLQKGLFAQHPDIHLLSNSSAPWNCKLLQHIIGKSERSFDLGAAQDSLEKLKNKSKPVQVVSAERLSGHPLSGGFDSFLIARRIKMVCPQAKIIIGVRHQFSMLRSLYIQMLKEGFIGSFSDFVGSPSWKRPFFRQDYLEYHYLVTHYQKLFGHENVLVQLYEELNVSPQQWLNDICNFMSIDYYSPDNMHTTVNKTNSKLVSSLLRRNFLRKSEYNLHPLPENISQTLLNSLVADIDAFNDDAQNIKKHGLQLDAFTHSNAVLFEKLGRQNAYSALDAQFLS